MTMWGLMVDQFRSERLKSEDKLNATCVVFNLERALGINHVVLYG
jgi:hypothetical protein